MVSGIIYRYVVFRKSGWFITNKKKTRFPETGISFVQEVYMVL